ncbi:TetR family transcriptional regulator C-terminal domain-containing protein [Brucella sp. NBRC 12950]|uniref:TetR/AcrR family transcriptional regulator n=1 Tax=Brucella sp. NBRC 12950 TaxID=2994518 RepID=UPI002554B083|nr:TetR family transcriptional regulator C-terminal domain-containing protein [Brucella sp. NBRC 12950]
MTESKRRGPRFSRELPAVRRRMLVEAATRCLSRGGITALTTDNIRKEAKVSIGLVAHHFSGKDEILSEVYQVSLYDDVHRQILEAAKSRANASNNPEQRLCDLIQAQFSEKHFSKDNLHIWLSLWGEIDKNETLRTQHRQLWRSYREALELDITALAIERGLIVKSGQLAINFIALFDGLWLEWCLDPTAVSREDAVEGCYSLLEAQLGPLVRPIPALQQVAVPNPEIK